MKIWLFGDSFATLEYPPNYHNTESWVEKLNNNFEEMTVAQLFWGGGAGNLRKY